MSILVFHGDQPKTSREAFNRHLLKLRAEGFELRYLEGAALTVPELESSLAQSNLFVKEALVIDNLLSRPKSRELTACLKLLSRYRGPKPLVFWDKKTLTKTTLNFLPQPKLEHFKEPALIFRLLDTLTPDSSSTSLKLLKQTAQVSDEGFIFIMLARRLGDLLIAKSGDSAKLHPFQRSHLLSQAQRWSDHELLFLHQRFISFDHRLKTGQTKLSYRQFLDLTLSQTLG